MRLVIAGVALLAGLAGAEEAPWKRHTIDASSKGADGVRVIDVNRDGHLDITTGWEQGGVIRVCVNPGPKRSQEEWPAVTVGKVGGPEDAVFVDLDGDGAIDVVSSCEGRTRTTFVHWAPKNASDYLDPSAWKTDAFPATEKKQSWMYALPLEVDGRHGIDLVIGSKGGDASVGWLQAPKDPRAVADWKFHRLYDAGWIMTLDAFDVDGDGDDDVLVSDRKGKNAGVKWLENPGAAAAAKGDRWAEHPIGSKGKEVMFLRIADLDGDGRKDLLATNRNGHIEWFRRAPGAEVGWESHSFPLAFGLPWGKSLGVGDINLDGQLDVVTTSRGKEPVRCVAWQEFKKSPTEKQWIDHDIGGTTGAKFDLIELIDLDGDGDLDVVTCEEVANLGVFWYENPLK